MLNISTLQKQQFAQQHINDFISKVYKKFSIFFPFFERKYDTKTFKVLVYDTIDTAQTYNLTTEKQIFKYLLIILIMGENFDISPEHKLLADFLNDKDAFPDDKIYNIYAYIQETKPEYYELSEWLLD